MNEQLSSFGNYAKEIATSSKKLLNDSGLIGGKGKNKTHLPHHPHLNRSLSEHIEETYWELTGINLLFIIALHC